MVVVDDESGPSMSDAVPPALEVPPVHPDDSFFADMPHSSSTVFYPEIFPFPVVLGPDGFPVAYLVADSEPETGLITQNTCKRKLKRQTTLGSRASRRTSGPRDLTECLDVVGRGIDSIHLHSKAGDADIMAGLVRTVANKVVLTSSFSGWHVGWWALVGHRT